MGGGGQQTDHGEPHSGGDAGVYTWAEVQKHSSKNDQWLVINRKVYNITQWGKSHPGGFEVISHYAGEDATEAFTAFHPDQKFVQKFLKPLLIGELKATEPSQDHSKNAAIIQDFDILREQVEKQGLFQAKPLFYCLHLGQILVLEALAWLIVWLWGTSWTLTLVCSGMLAIAQAQAGWLQHDLGHLSVFKKSQWNHLMHKFVIGHLKGASVCWWNPLHFQHHAKPNIFKKDLDIDMFDMVLLGATQPVEYGIKKIKFMPYNHQHKYFSLVISPLAIPVIYIYNIIVMITHRAWVDLAWCMTYYFRYFYCYIPLCGLFGSLILMISFRVLESLWFVWVTQMNHLSMAIDHEKHQDWVTMQLQATCNIEQSLFNDWFTGHLNFQIEHHLFPRMPRHNCQLVAPQVRALCKKHGIPYEVKTLWRAMADVVRSLKTSGDLWLDAYLYK